MNKQISLSGLANKKINVLVIGSSRGLGKEFVLLLNNNGEVGRVFNLLTPNRQELDLLDLEQTQKFVLEHKPDVIVNFAVTNKNSLIHKTDILTDKDSFDALRLGTVSQFNLVQSALKHMRENRFGRIILFSSIIKEQPLIGTAVYGCSKAFVEQMSKHVAKENALFNITCNTIQLGYCETGLINEVDPKIISNLNIPSKRLCKTDEVNKLIVSILSNEYLNGTTIQLNGGM